MGIQRKFRTLSDSRIIIAGTDYGVRNLIQATITRHVISFSEISGIISERAVIVPITRERFRDLRVNDSQLTPARRRDGVSHGPRRIREWEEVGGRRGIETG